MRKLYFLEYQNANQLSSRKLMSNIIITSDSASNSCREYDSDELVITKKYFSIPKSVNSFENFPLCLCRFRFELDAWFYYFMGRKYVIFQGGIFYDWKVL